MGKMEEEGKGGGREKKSTHNQIKRRKSGAGRVRTKQLTGLGVGMWKRPRVR